MASSIIEMMDAWIGRGTYLWDAPRWKRIALRLLPRRWKSWGFNRLHIYHCCGIPLFRSEFLVGYIYPLEGESDG